MKSIIREKFVRNVEDDGELKCLVRVELCVDSSADLPAVDYKSGQLLAQGSIAWDISTGDFYGLTSTGEWVNQTAPSQSGAKSLTLSNPSPQKGEKIEIEQPEEKELEFLDIEDLEEKGEEENDEPVRDTESKKD